MSVVHRQPRDRRGPRQPLPSSVTAAIKRAVNRDARRWKCSRSWIVATALAAFYDIDIVKPEEAEREKKVLRFPRRLAS